MRKLEFPATKTFNGKVYNWNGRYDTKAEALKFANSYRSKGSGGARVVKAKMRPLVDFPANSGRRVYLVYTRFKSYYS